MNPLASRFVLLASAVCVACSAVADQPKPPVVTRTVKNSHILFVFDDKAAFAENLGVAKDKQNWLETFTSIGTSLNLQPGKDFTVTVLEGDEATPDHIRAYYRDLRIQPQEDGLVFIYSGHGSFNERDGHILNLHGDREIPRSEIREMMEAHNGSLSVMITDCCGERAPVLPKFNTFPDQPKGQRMCASLFYYHRGFVDLNSSEMGTLSYGHSETGGNFSHAFRRLLYGARMNSDAANDALVDIDNDDTWSDVTWIAFTDLLKLELESVSKEYRDGIQKPHVFSLPGGFLGLHARELNPVGKPKNLEGLLIHNVLPNSPAELAGLSQFQFSVKPKRTVIADLVISINGILVRDARDFEQIIDRCDGTVKIRLQDPITKRTRIKEVRLRQDRS